MGYIVRSCSEVKLHVQFSERHMYSCTPVLLSSKQPKLGPAPDIYGTGAATDLL